MTRVTKQVTTPINMVPLGEQRNTHQYKTSIDTNVYTQLNLQYKTKTR